MKVWASILVTFFLSNGALIANQQGTLPRNLYPVRIRAIPQADCPLTIEQYENSADGQLQTADFQNHNPEAIESLRVGWKIQYKDTTRTPDLLPGRIIDLRPSLSSGARVTLSAAKIGALPALDGAERIELYVYSGYFTNGSRFVCGSASAKAGRT